MTLHDRMQPGCLFTFSGGTRMIIPDLDLDLDDSCLYIYVIFRMFMYVDIALLFSCIHHYTSLWFYMYTLVCCHATSIKFNKFVYLSSFLLCGMTLLFVFVFKGGEDDCFLLSDVVYLGVLLALLLLLVFPHFHLFPAQCAPYAVYFDQIRISLNSWTSRNFILQYTPHKGASSAAASVAS